jgi:hypothetical protein
MIIGNVLDQHEVGALQEAALSIPFEDGKKQPAVTFVR